MHRKQKQGEDRLHTPLVYAIEIAMEVQDENLWRNEEETKLVELGPFVM